MINVRKIFALIMCFLILISSTPTGYSVVKVDEMSKPDVNKELLVEYISGDENVLANQVIEGSKKDIISILEQFMPNTGQFDDTVLWYGNFGPNALYVDKDSVLTYLFLHGSEKDPIKAEESNSSSKGTVIKETFLNKSSHEKIKGKTKGYDYNRITGKKINSIETGYKSLSFVHLYKNIDLVLEHKGKTIEKTFVLSPNANVSEIQIKLEGQDSLSMDSDGKLILNTPNGDIYFTKPVAWQGEVQRTLVEISYWVSEDQYGFTLGNYDHNKPLYIDPEVVSTYFGGSAYYTVVNDIQTDLNDNIFIVGSTKWNTFPTTAGAYDETLNGGLAYEDGFITKINNDLSMIEASTYIGGSGNYDDNCQAIDIDKWGNIYVGIYTKTSDFPVTSLAYDTTYNGGRDISIVKFSNDLSNLEKSTYIGGSQDDTVKDIAIDNDGNIVITGYSTKGISNFYPTTQGVYQENHNAGIDAFVSVLSPDLSTLIASTYIGGSTYTSEAYEIEISSQGDIYIAGDTQCSNFPTTTGSFSSTHHTDIMDIFISRFNSDLTELKSSTLFGGTSSPVYEIVRGMKILSNGNLVIAGSHAASDFPVTAGVFDETYNGYDDGFISILKYDLSSLITSTTIGGASNDIITDIEIDHTDNIYFTGYTSSSDFPVTSDALSSTNFGQDVILGKITPNLDMLCYSTYIGGSSKDVGNTIYIDQNDTLYIAGVTTSNNFPVTTGALQTMNNSSISFVLKSPRELTGLAAADWVKYDSEKSAVAYGGKVFEVPLINIAGFRNVPLSMTFNSILLNNGPLGQGWNHNYETRLVEHENGNVLVEWSQNHFSRFYLNGDGSYSSDIKFNPYDTLVKNETGYKLKMKSGDIFFFNLQGTMVTEKNKYGDELSFTYDSNDNLLKITDSGSSRSLTFAYNTEILIESVTDPLNRMLSFEYNTQNQLTSFSDADGYKTYFYYNDAGQLSSVLNNYFEAIQTNVYDTKGRIIGIDDAIDDDKSVEIAYDVNTNQNTIIATITDRNGAQDVETYSGDYYLNQSLNSVNYAKSYTYDNLGNLTSFTNEKGVITQLEWDDRGNLTRVYDNFSHNDIFVYDDNNNILSYENSTNDVASFVYDASNRLTDYYDFLDNHYNYQYDALGNLIQITKPRGGTIKYEYKDGQPISLQKNNEMPVHYTYDAAGRITSKSDQLYNEVNYTYDGRDHLTKLVNALDDEWNYIFDCNGNLIEKINSLGMSTTYNYDGNNRLIWQTDALNLTTYYEYDAENRLITITNPMNESIHFTYDTIGRILTESDDVNYLKSYTYDELGNLTSVKDAYGQTVESYTYDEFGNCLTKTDGLNNTTEYSYDLLNQMTYIRDALQRETNFDFDSLGNIIQAVGANDGISSMNYDSDGNRVNIIDQNGNEISFQYDLAGRLISEQKSDENSIDYAYDSRGKLSLITNARLQDTELTYDELGRLIELNDPVGVIQYGYDSENRLTTITDDTGSILRTFDDIGRLTTYEDANGNIIKYGYDNANRLKTLTYPDQKVVTYGYDSSGRLNSVTDWSNRTTTYSYDDNNRLTNITRPDASYQINSYNAIGNLISIKDYDSQNTIITDSVIEYDSVYNITSEANNNAETVNTFDEMNHLTTQSIYENEQLKFDYNFTFDKGNNLTSYANTNSTTSSAIQISIGANNQITTYGESNFTYDADGNMVNGLLNGALQIFVYDARNRLRSVGNTAYQYDAENLRTQITDDGVVSEYIIDSNALLSKVLMKTTQGKTTYYVYGLGLIAEETNDTYLSYHYDFRGSTIALTNISGDVTDTYTYSPYGQLMSHVGNSNVDFLFNGQFGVITDPNGLLFMRTRYYSPELMRFINEDSYVGKYNDILNLNNYGYANGNPVTNNDPNGQFAHILVSAGIGALFNIGLELVMDFSDDGQINEGIKSYLGAGLSGAVAGSFVGATGGTSLAAMVGSAYGGATFGSIADQLVVDNSINLNRTMVDGLSGAAGGALAYGAGKILSSSSSITKGTSETVDMTRVGRWMSEDEYGKMIDTGYVQESFSSTTHVANPASYEAYFKQTNPGNIYAEFDVPTSALKQTQEGWAKIIGPNSIDARLLEKKGLPFPTEMPMFQNLEWLMKK